MQPRINSVWPALRDCGRRKALTPFAIDSTPVSADEPDANAFEQHEQADRAGAGCHGMRGNRGRAAPGGALVKPTPIVVKRTAMKAYVGRANATRLTNAAEIYEHDPDDADDESSTSQPCRNDAVERDREHARSDRDRHREDVVGQQRRARHKCRQDPRFSRATT